MPQREGDPLVTFHFLLDLSGKAQGLFTEISGLGSETEVVETKVTDSKGRDFIKKVPGRLKFTDVTLKRGVTKEMDFWKWRQMVVEGKASDARTNCTITMLSTDLEPVAQWNLQNAWPSKISGPQAQAESSTFGMEELTITYEFLERVS
ncbi:MAG TPA: phage tail protein [Tepidiformaceae bacterium]|nr:phage tail protein [Tepidiformaceae bacterium]